MRYIQQYVLKNKPLQFSVKRFNEFHLKSQIYITVHKINVIISQAVSDA